MSTLSFQGASGHLYLRGDPLGVGATGQVWRAWRQDSAEPLVLKLFDPRFGTPTMRRRTAWLAAQRLDRASPVLHAPVDIVDGPIGFGHVSAFAGGVPLEAYLGTPIGDPLDHLVCAAAMAAGVAAMEQRGIAHGDLRWANFRIGKRFGVLRAGLIDFDTCVAPDLPPPPSIGQIRYAAPEIRRDPQPARLGIATDRYALAMLLRELLAGMFDRDGLGRNLQGLFRRALGAAPDARPRASEWFAALRQAAENVHQCDHCGRPFIAEASTRHCPHCVQPLSGLSIFRPPSVRESKEQYGV